MDELKSKLSEKQAELEDIKEEIQTEKKNHEKIVADLKSDGRKRSDKLKVIELNEEVDKLRSELQRARFRDGITDGRTEGVTDGRKA